VHHFPRNGLGRGGHGEAAAAAAWDDDISDAACKQQTSHYIHTYIQTLDNAHNSQVQGLNLWRSLGGKTTVDINDEQTYGFLDET